MPLTDIEMQHYHATGVSSQQKATTCNAMDTDSNNTVPEGQCSRSESVGNGPEARLYWMVPPSLGFSYACGLALQPLGICFKAWEVGQSHPSVQDWVGWDRSPQTLYSGSICVLLTVVGPLFPPSTSGAGV